MTGKFRVLIIFIVLLISGGCARRPVYSMEVDKTITPVRMVSDPLTATPGQQPILPVTDSPVASPTIFRTSPPVAVAIPPDFSPILYGKKYDANTFFILLGGVKEGKWITPELAAANINGALEYDVYSFANENFQVLSYAPETAPVHPGKYFMGTEASYDQFGMVGVARGWPIRHGKAEELSPDNQIYEQVVLDWLKEVGIPKPRLGTLRIFRIDLEGDGSDEIFISATHLDSSQHFTKSGDYSLILMRKVVRNDAVTLPIVADVYRSQEPETTYPRSYLPANFIDLNRDGVLEVVIDYHRWEEDGALVYTIEGQNITQVP